MTGHGSKKGMSLIKLASSRGEKVYHGKACACGSTEKRVDNTGCTTCCGKTKEAREAIRNKKVDVFAMASIAFKVGNERA
jgi:hypothetical protein